MKNYKISVQRGLNEISDLLISKGYDVCQSGKCGSKANIAIVEVSDYEYEGLNTMDCRQLGADDKILVINSANQTPAQVLEIIENKIFTCYH